MTRKLSYYILFLFSLVMSSEVFFDYNKIATHRELGVDCRVSDPEERTSIKIHNDDIDITMITGCIIKSNDSRLSIACKETEGDVLLSVNLTNYTTSDVASPWICSDGKSHDTVSFPDFIEGLNLPELSLNATNVAFQCTVHKDCYLPLPLGYWHVYPSDDFLQLIDGTTVFRTDFDHIEVYPDYKGRIMFTDNYTFPFLNFTFMEMRFYDAGIYYILESNSYRFVTVAAFIIQVRDNPKQPVISAQNLSSEFDQGLYKLMCFSESRTQPVFSRSPLFFHWKINGRPLTDQPTCFKRRGPELTLCRESCHLETNVSISVTCTAEEDGLMSNDSEPFIIRLITSPVPVKCPVTTSPISASVEHNDQKSGHSTEILIGACLGCVVAASVISILSTLLIVRRSVLCKTEDIGSRFSYDLRKNSGDRNEPCYVNSIVDSGRRATEIESTRQYEKNTMEHPKSPYAMMQSKG